MEILRKIYTKVKKYPLIGPIIIFLRNIPRWPIFLNPRLRRKDYQKAKTLFLELFGQPAVDQLDNFRNSDLFKKNFSFGHAGDFDLYILYVLIKMIKPEVVVETGVASGRSSMAVLLALKENQKGRLYSIDLPLFYEGENPETYITHEGNQEFKGFVPQGKQPGWLIPDDLRERWELILGDSNQELPKLFERFAKVDLFYHDSDHSYETMIFEFRKAWPLIPEGGFLLSDDIKWNNSFEDFKAEVDYKFEARYRGLGILKK